MYKLVLQSIEEYVRVAHGDKAWEDILRRSDIDEEVLLGRETCDDSVVLSLLAVAAARVKLSTSDLLLALGRHWISHRAPKDHGPLLTSTGRSFHEFMLNLPGFQARVEGTAAVQQPARFTCRSIAPGRLLLHCRADRSADFAPFILGMLDGSGRRFNTPIEVRHQVQRSAGADHDEFLIAWSESLAA